MKLHFPSMKFDSQKRKLFFHFFLLSFAASLLASANDEVKNSIQLGSTIGEGQYRSVRGVGTAALDQVWSIKLGGSLSFTGDPENKTTSVELGPNIRYSENFDAAIQLNHVSEPNQIVIAGVSGGINLGFKTFGSSNPNTSVSLFGHASRIRQSLDLSSNTPRIEDPLYQTGGGFGVYQQVTGKFSVGGSYYQFYYNRSTQTLNEAVNSRKYQFAGMSSIIEGFPLFSYAVELGWEIQKHFFSSLGLEHTKTLLTHELTRSVYASIQCHANENWLLGLGGSFTRTLGYSGTSAVDTNVTFTW